MTRGKWNIFILLVLMLLLMGQTAYAQAGTQTADTSALLSTSLKIEGMVWPICERTAESVLGRLDGVVAADADFRTGQAVVTYDPSQTDPQRIVEAFNSQSFYRASVAAGTGGAPVAQGNSAPAGPAETANQSLTDSGAQPATTSSPADVIYAAIGIGKYVLWGLVGLALVGLIWQVVGRKFLRIQIRFTK